jgi:hypothetical protein
MASVYIVDRYFAKNFYERLCDGTRSVKTSGAGWFLTHLARSGVRTLHIASSARELRERDDADVVQAAITKWFNTLSHSAELDLQIVAGNFRHRRSLAFDGYAAFELHNGLDSFDGATVPEEMTLTAQAGTAPKVASAFEQLTSLGR